MGFLKRNILFFLIAAMVGYCEAYAQTETSVEAPVSHTVENVIQEGEIIVDYDIPSDILDNLNANPGSLVKPGTAKRKGGTSSGIKKGQGFRIQVFGDGRNPATLQARAKARGNAIVAKFPKYRGQIYSFSASPNWYTRVGNFKTSKEANDALAELKRAFPSFAAEMRVVKSPITIIR